MAKKRSSHVMPNLAIGIFAIAGLSITFLLLMAVFFDFPTPKIFAPVPEAQAKELVNERTLVSKVYDLGGNKRHAIFHEAPIHYPDETGALQDIDITVVPSDKPDYVYEVERGIYKAYFRERFDAESVVDIVDRDEDTTVSTVSFVSRDLSLIKQDGSPLSLKSPQPGNIHVDENIIRYIGAYGDGVDVQMQYEPERFVRELVINSYDALDIPSTTPEEGYIDLGFSFSFRFPEQISLTIDGESWNGEDTISSKRIALWDTDRGEEIFVFRRPEAVDAANTVEPLSFHVKNIEDEVVITKRISLSWLKQATYPIRADDTLNKFSTGDALLNKEDSSYATAHDATTGVLSGTGTTANVGQYNSLGTYGIYRSVLYFDTTSLGANAILSAATLKLRGQSENGSEDYSIEIYEWTPATAGTITSSDYNQTAYGATLYASMTTSTWITTGYNNFTLSPTSLVKQTASTTIGVRSSKDTANTAPGTGVTEHVSFRTVETSGTTSDPTLSVTYTTNVAPTITAITPRQTSTNEVTVDHAKG